jgi:PAS domain S-box-containing protein
MTEQVKSVEELARENDSLRTRLEEVTDVLTAIRTGGVDALVVEGPNGEQVFTMEGADHPYRTFVETMNEGAVTLAMDGTIVYCNRRFADLVGTLLEETFGRAFLDYVAPPDRPEFKVLLEQGDDDSVRAELSLEQPDGTEIPVQFSARRLPQNCGNYWCLVITDLRSQELHDALLESEERLRIFVGSLEQRVEERTSELVASQERLRALVNELNRTEQRERKRVATELHDYLAQLLALAIMKLSQVKQKTELPTVSDLVNAVQEVLREALDYTRTLVADLTPPLLHDVGLASALRWLAVQMQRHQLAVITQIPSGDDPNLSEEQALLVFQSVRELLVNVSKHSGVGEATVPLAQRDGRLWIELRDRGKGFDVKMKAGLVGGVNFGLFSIRERMQALGGSFELESAAEKGTRATLVLPMGVESVSNFRSKDPGSELSESTISHQPSARKVQSSNSELTTRSSRQPPIRVLLVDDHAMVRQGLRSLLDGYTDIEVVGEASDGEEALAGIVTHQPAVVVMDINMSKMNGIETTAVLKDRYPKIIVIGLSVQAGEEMQQAMLQAGASALLTKEAAVDQLYQTIQAVQKAIYT